MAKILIVEDDANNRDLIARLVELMGHEPILAADGAQGVALARSAQPDLIVMDMGLPVLNGWQATHRIKSQPAHQAYSDPGIDCLRPHRRSDTLTGCWL
jgi:Response regulators consisting of a CheY-like receiver domain and a winged-helix DNA-binding domain